jgi:FkbM family methyltransferase
VADTLARRLLRQLPRFGLEVTDIRPGMVVVARVRRGGRTNRLSVKEISPGTVLLTEPATVRKHRREHDKGLSAHLLSSLLMDVFGRYRVDVVLDVGANKGQYARSLRRAGYKGRIVSFEPVARDFEELQGHAADDPLWSVHKMALGRENGSLEMNVVPGTLSSVLPATEFGARRYDRLQEPTVERVEVRRLDGILDDLLADMTDPRPYLKLDTQGFDLEAFAGLGERVADFVGMQSEVAFLRIYEGMPRMPESLAVYEAAGFEVAGLYAVSRERRTARALEFDCLMVRADALPGD